MPRALEFARAAAAEAAEARRWYKDRDTDLADRFTLELDAAITAVMNNPDRWQGIGRNARRFLLHDFPYSVIYRFDDSRIRILAVAHFKRRPGYWDSRR